MPHGIDQPQSPRFGLKPNIIEGSNAKVYRSEMFVTPTKKDSINARNLNTNNSDFKNCSSESSHRPRILSSPESFFTPLRIPGSSKNDTAEYSKNRLFLKHFI
jgi:hypothetical protein